MIWAPSSSRTAWVSPLTVPWLATGMKAGVSTVPWAVARSPVLAEEPGSRAVTVNDFVIGRTGNR